MTLKKGDFIALDFVGRIKETGDIFDLTKKDVAEKEKIANKSAEYSPRIVCVGHGDIVKGVDDFLVGKTVGKSYTIELESADAFGKKDAKLIKMMPLSTFKKQDMKPFPGLQVNIDGSYGTIRTVSGGRVLVDFNHPLASKAVTYEITITKVITKDAEKVSGILKGIINRDVTCTVDKGTATVDIDLPEQFQTLLNDRITSLVPTIKKVIYAKKDTPSPESTK